MTNLSNSTQNSYSPGFYADQIEGSYKSAQVYLTHLWKYIQPNSLIDIGCGRGAWLNICGDLGATTLYGLDGKWNSQTNMLDQRIKFFQVDLSEGFVCDQKFDLALSLEVAEHVEPQSSNRFIASLVECSDLVMFGAAYIGQGGTGHVNERRHSFWASLFNEHDYGVFDFFRPYTWANEDVEFWYRQNTFLYARRGSKHYVQLTSLGLSELPNYGFMDCIHPKLFDGRQISIVNIFSAIIHRVLPITFIRYLRKKRKY